MLPPEVVTVLISDVEVLPDGVLVCSNVTVPPFVVCSVSEVTVSIPDDTGIYETVSLIPLEFVKVVDDGVETDGIDVNDVFYPLELTPVTIDTVLPPEVTSCLPVKDEVFPFVPVVCS